jgi:hypothetical protein
MNRFPNFEHRMIGNSFGPEQELHAAYHLVVPDTDKDKALAILKQNKIDCTFDELRSKQVLDPDRGTQIPGEFLLSIPREQGNAKVLEEDDLNAIQSLLEKGGIVVRQTRQ